MKETLWFILKQNGKQQTSDMILKFKDSLQQADILRVMKNSGVKEISKYTKQRAPFSGYVSGSPAHVKSAINYNDMLTTLTTDVVSIKDGEKVKWAYLRNNPYGFDTMALRGYQDPPEIVEFVNTYIDRNKQFERELKGKLNDFYAAMNWGGLPENNNASKFFSFGK
jgi:hypothetical protein